MRVERLLTADADRPRMNRKLHVDTNELMREVVRYLAAVELFRSELCEPTWLPELPSAGGPSSHVTPGGGSTPRPAPGAKRG